MNIVIITNYSYLDGKATSNRLQALAHALDNCLEKPHNIIITSIEKDNRPRDDKPAVTTSLVVRSVETNKLFKNSFLILRGLEEVFLSFKLWRKAVQHNPNIIIVTVPSMALLLPVILLNNKANLVIDVRDLVWEYLGGLGITKSIIRVISIILFKLSARKADLITVVTIAGREKLVELTQKKCVVIKNGISLSKLNALQNLGDYKGDTPITMSYMGNIGIAQELEILIELADIMPELKVKLVGDGARLGVIKSKALHLSNVEFHGHVSWEELVEHYRNSHILFAQLGDGYNTALPSKIFEYVATGRKIVVGLPCNNAKNVLRQFDGVYTYEPNDLEGLVSCVTRAIAAINHDSKKNIDILKRDYLREFESNKFAEQVSSIISNINVPT